MEQPSQSDAVVSDAKTQGEVNVHLGYIRRDIIDMKKDTTEKLQEIKEQITKLDDHYISEAEYKPVRDAVEAHGKEIKSLTEWRDTFNGKIIGFGVAISIATSVLTFALT